MLGNLTKSVSVSMRVVLMLMGWVVSGGAGAATADEPVVTVESVMLLERSTEQSTTDLSSMGVRLTDPGELIPGDTLFLELWFQVTVGPEGISSAVLNIQYEASLLFTSLAKITLASQWTNLWVPELDGATGLITDVGGLSISGRGLEPNWAKLATIEFVVIETPGAFVLTACTVDAGPRKGFGMLGIGEVEEVDYRCSCADWSNPGTLGVFVTCLSGPEGTAELGCSCADANQDTYVDLVDFAAFQVAFHGD